MVTKVNVGNVVAEAIDNIDKLDNSNIVLSTGVVLKSNRVSSMIFSEIVKRFQKPKPPIVQNEDIGRKEPNYSDPLYIAEMDLYNQNVANAIIDTMILMGTKLVSVPKDFPNILDNDWVSDLEMIGITFNKDSFRARYLFWVKCIASPFDEDITKITESVGGLSGVREEDVSAAVEKFRSGTE